MFFFNAFLQISKNYPVVRFFIQNSESFSLDKNIYNLSSNTGKAVAVRLFFLT